MAETPKLWAIVWSNPLNSFTSHFECCFHSTTYNCNIFCCSQCLPYGCCSQNGKVALSYSFDTYSVETQYVLFDFRNHSDSGELYKLSVECMIMMQVRHYKFHYYCCSLFISRFKIYKLIKCSAMPSLM